MKKTEVDLGQGVGMDLEEEMEENQVEEETEEDQMEEEMEEDQVEEEMEEGQVEEEMGVGKELVHRMNMEHRESRLFTNFIVI